ncbi:MAG: hypothetical protein IKY31_03485 [Bacteroidaceae bacterium]|nr:hypothetical protein [Bacteroidaceae bacterium]
MPQYLQQRIIKAKTTFPLMMVFALLLWFMGIEWPLNSMTTISGWWGNISCPTWITEGANLLLCLYILYQLAEVNNAYSLVKRRTMLHGIIFMLLWVSAPFSCHSIEANLLLCSLLTSISFLFRSFQQRESSVEIFNLFLFLGLSSVIALPTLCLIPLFYMAMWFFQSLSIRSFFAGLIGILWPYWILFVYALSADKLPLFTDLFDSFTHAMGHYADIPLMAWVLYGVSLVLFICSFAYISYQYGRYKIRTRLLLSFLLWWTFFMMVMWILFPLSYALFFPILFMSVSILAGHLFSHTTTRLSSILFLVVSAILVSITIYSNLWILW